MVLSALGAHKEQLTHLGRGMPCEEGGCKLSSEGWEGVANGGKEKRVRAELKYCLQWLTVKSDSVPLRNWQRLGRAGGQGRAGMRMKMQAGASSARALRGPWRGFCILSSEQRGAMVRLSRESKVRSGEWPCHVSGMAEVGHPGTKGWLCRRKCWLGKWWNERAHSLPLSPED